MLRVLHLVGSPTDAFFDELSQLYAADCLEAVADPSRYEPTIAHVARDGAWRFPSALTEEALSAAEVVPLASAVQRLTEGQFDVAVPQLFCRPGMTTYRALLDLLGVPFVGNPAEVMALGTDKARCKAVVASAGVAVPAGEVVMRGQRTERPLPVVVKPVDADNSAGLSLVREPGALAAALDTALAHSDRALVEDYVELGREVRCGVLERHGALTVLPLEEYAVDAQHKPVRDSADKLARDAAGRLGLVAKDAAHAWTLEPDDPLNEVVGEPARRAHRALGARHYSLFDFRIDPSGRPWFLEAGLYCSFARTSVVAVMAQAAGISVRDLFAQLVDDVVSQAAPRSATGRRRSGADWSESGR